MGPDLKFYPGTLGDRIDLDQPASPTLTRMQMKPFQTLNLALHRCVFLRMGFSPCQQSSPEYASTPRSTSDYTDSAFPRSHPNPSRLPLAQIALHRFRFEFTGRAGTPLRITRSLRQNVRAIGNVPDIRFCQRFPLKLMRSRSNFYGFTNWILSFYLRCAKSKCTKKTGRAASAEAARCRRTHIFLMIFPEQDSVDA